MTALIAARRASHALDASRRALCGRGHRPMLRSDRSRRSARSHRAAVRAERGRTSTRRPKNAPIRSAMTPIRRSRASCTVTRSRAVQTRCRLPGLLPVLFSPRDGRAGRRDRLVAAGLRGRARLYRRASRDLGGDPDRRRSVHAHARRAGDVGERLAAIAHVKIIRWHTRVPGRRSRAYRPTILLPR